MHADEYHAAEQNGQFHQHNQFSKVLDEAQQDGFERIDIVVSVDFLTKCSKDYGQNRNAQGDRTSNDQIGCQGKKAFGRVGADD